MGQINPFSDYAIQPVQIDPSRVGDGTGGHSRRKPKRPKPESESKDPVDLHTDSEDSPAAEITPADSGIHDGHVDVTA